MKGILFGLVFMLALVAASCYDDDDLFVSNRELYVGRLRRRPDVQIMLPAHLFRSIR